MPEQVLRVFSKVQYMGSFPVAGPDQATRAEYMRTQLQRMRGTARTKSVLLVISLAGIKVCSPDGKSVHMAHALRRISYATCDPEHAQFSFLAREPRGHFSLQYCHSFLAQSAEQYSLHSAATAVDEVIDTAVTMVPGEWTSTSGQLDSQGE
ncbi:SH2 domain-containing protein 5-like [Bacillus rossius redtenbacheri]|uniref:SH2 domain-containing protein 5-like n=1 Tax=Bacillus rossius redtenbacheri TaxID=93214 RepID=UPI002FDDF4E7